MTQLNGILAISKPARDLRLWSWWIKQTWALVTRRTQITSCCRSPVASGFSSTPCPWHPSTLAKTMQIEKYRSYKDSFGPQWSHEHRAGRLRSHGVWPSPGVTCEHLHRMVTELRHVNHQQQCYGRFRPSTSLEKLRTFTNEIVLFTSQHIHRWCFQDRLVPQFKICDDAIPVQVFASSNRNDLPSPQSKYEDPSHRSPI